MWMRAPLEPELLWPITVIDVLPWKKKTAFLGVGLAEALEKAAFWGAGLSEALEKQYFLVKTALLGAEKNGLIRLQLQFKLQCCNSPELITWL